MSKVKRNKTEASAKASDPAETMSAHEESSGEETDVTDLSTVMAAITSSQN